ncbi:MAG: aminopeptidase P family protein [Clostridia bacterium]|nr:aminopeptidase P family protein [Clostridia bacterium]
MNISKLKKFLQDKDYAAFIVSEENRRYFTSFPSSDGFLIVTAEKSVFLTDSRYIEAAQQQCVDCDEVLLFKSVKESIVPVVEELGIKKLAVESGRITLRQLAMYSSGINVKFETDNALENAIEDIRLIKSRKEIDLVVKAQRIAEKAFEHILGFIKVGMTEREIGLELDYFMLRNGADALSFETIAVSGEKTSMPHGVPGMRRIQNGDFITMDYGAVVDGYHSDMTRTIAVGSVSQEQKRVYDTVLKAQTEAFAVMKPGVPCADVDKAARDVIAQAGYGDYFGHGLGHGVGIEIHEEPRLSPFGKKVLESGFLVTNEPGIYLPGKFGVRIEDMAFITDDGYENLIVCPKELIII